MGLDKMTGACTSVQLYSASIFTFHDSLYAASISSSLFSSVFLLLCYLLLPLPLFPLQLEPQWPETAQLLLRLECHAVGRGIWRG